MESILGVMEGSMLETGRTIRCMGWESSPGLMEGNTRHY